MKMKITATQLRKFHRILAPIMILPVLFTVATGVIFQIAELGGFEDQFRWIIHWHKGNFGYLDFQKSYPFLNAAGLLFLSITGISMWFRTRHSSKVNSKRA